MAMNKLSPELQGLADATNTDPYATDYLSLDARARRRGEDTALQADADWQDQQFNPENPYFGMNRNMLIQRPNILPQHTPWSTFFEALQESGARQGKSTELGGVEGLRTEKRISPFTGTLPLALQGLKGVQYTMTPGGRPIAATYNK